MSYITERFPNIDGHIVDTQMDPKTLKAQEEFDAKCRVARPKTKGFSQPSEQDMRDSK